MFSSENCSSKLQVHTLKQDIIYDGCVPSHGNYVFVCFEWGTTGKIKDTHWEPHGIGCRLEEAK